jgi:dTDP-glucose 4,6-dehydratase
MRIVVTGGAGFIGSALVRHLIGHTDHEVLVVDKLTDASNLASLASVQGHPRYHFIRSDICMRSAIAEIFSSFGPTL